MAGQSEKRSSRRELADLELLDRSDTQGVGGRQTVEPPTPMGGGYLDTCTGFKLLPGEGPDRDPRLDELRSMGLPSVWLRISAVIGVDAFLATWRILDAEPAFRSDDGDLDIRMRSFRSYLRYQRNRYIEALCGAGLSAKEIQEAVHCHLCERISIRHISRIKSGN